MPELDRLRLSITPDKLPGQSTSGFFRFNYPSEFTTLGDHIRATRIDRDLLQRDVALLLGASTESVLHWELGQTHPQLEVLPRIMEFLGYCPYEPALTLGVRLIAIRQKLIGITQENMARAIGIHPTTLSRIERTDARCSKIVAEKIERYCAMLQKA